MLGGRPLEFGGIFSGLLTRAGTGKGHVGAPGLRLSTDGEAVKTREKYGGWSEGQSRHGLRGVAMSVSEGLLNPARSEQKKFGLL